MKFNNSFYITLLFLSNSFINGISYKQALEIGKRAYIYAYPLVSMAVTKDAMTDNGKRVNQFTHISEFPDYTFKDIVRPNVDTLYSFAWLDLSKGPIILAVPDTKSRYYIMEFMDAWTNVFASIGKRTTGTTAQEFVIVGPGYTNKIPEGKKVIKSPTNMVLILARTQTNGKSDYDFVRGIQDAFKLSTVDVWGTKIKPAHRNVTALRNKRMAPVDVVNGMDAQTFYTLFARELKNNPPASHDYAMVNELKKMGITPGKNFDETARHGFDYAHHERPLPAHPECLGVARRAKTDVSRDGVLKALNDAIPLAQKEIFDISLLGQPVNGWSIMRDIGTYGTRYLLRAQIAHIGIGANLPEDALYPTAYIDSAGKPLTGKNKYLLHFAKNMLPPANAFWSVALYNSESFLVKNKLNRYALGDRDKLTFNKDGSLDIYIQHASPGKNKESNWLPAPEGEFNVTMRIYWPKESVLNGTWNPPVIKRML